MKRLRSLGLELERQVVLLSSFFYKELWTVARQPRFVISFVLGPLLILTAFGIGYRGQSASFRTRLVLPPEARLPDDPAAYRALALEPFVIEGVTRDLAASQADLVAGRIDVILVAPAAAQQELEAGRRANFTVEYREANPIQATWIQYFATVAVQELNQQVLTRLVGNVTDRIQELDNQLVPLDEEAARLEEALRAGDGAGAAASALALQEGLGRTGASPNAALLLTLSVLPAGPADTIVGDLLAIQYDLALGQVDTPEQIGRAVRIRRSLDELHQETARLASIPPDVVTTPFAVRTVNTLSGQPTVLSFYAPAVVALLIQHMAVTLVSLSVVRERLLGAMDVYRVAPIGARDVIVGKSLGYGLMLGLVSAVLIVLINRLLGVPILGDLSWVALSLVLLIFASTGLGFFLAAFSATEMQAVQAAMIVLLAAIILGGFALPVDQLWGPIRFVSYLLPVTSGAESLRDAMLLGSAPTRMLLLIPTLLGVAFYAVAARSLGREMINR